MKRRSDMLSAIVFSVAISCVSGCSAQTQSTVTTPAQTQPAPFPQQFSFKSLPSGFQADFGLRAISPPPDLHGSLCYLGIKDGEQANRKNAKTAISDLQRLDIDAKTWKVQNFELPSYDLMSVGAIRFPTFRSSSNECFAMITRPGSDVGQYQLYNLDLKAQQGKRSIERLFAFNHIAVSPDRKSYAYETAEPWNEAYYRLVVVGREGKETRLSENTISEAFSWTPRNTVIYPDYPAFDPKVGYTKNNGYPNIYETDPKIHKRPQLIKEGGYRPLMSSDEKHLANFIAYIDPDNPDNKNIDPDSIRFSNSVGRVALAVYDFDTKRDHVVTRIYERYPDLFWSKDGKFLYVVENLYTFSKKTAFCRVSVYNTKTKTYKLLGKLEQKGEASSYEDGKLLPRFEPVKIANDKYLIFQVQIRASGKDNVHVLMVDLESGARNDILAFSDLASPYNIPLIDWIDAQPANEL